MSRGFLRVGDFDVEEYFYYDHPLHGDMHEVVPGKFIAFRGPSGDSARDDGLRAADYLDVFADKGVSTVVRLNCSEYKASTFRRAGFEHVTLIFSDCSVPSDRIVDRFLRVAETAQGLVAVHCLAGLGRTCTLIGLYLMKHHRFTAREAIGWLRVCRPGSVIGPQQQYLVQQEARMHRLGAQGLPGLGTKVAHCENPRQVLPQGIIMTGDIKASSPEDSAQASLQHSMVLAQMVTQGMLHRHQVRCCGDSLKHTHSATELRGAESSGEDEEGTTPRQSLAHSLAYPLPESNDVSSRSRRAAAHPENLWHRATTDWSSFTRTHYPRQFFDFTNGAHTSRIRPHGARKSVADLLRHHRQALFMNQDADNADKDNQHPCPRTLSELSSAPSAPSTPRRSDYDGKQAPSCGALCDARWKCYARAHFPRQFARAYAQCGLADSGASPCLVLDRRERARAFSHGAFGAVPACPGSLMI